ncbi:MAG: hypothetical protein AB3N17_05525 [Tateyamaria sp.]
MSTNIRAEHVSAFEALTSGQFENFALFSCFLNGAPASPIVAMTQSAADDGEVVITPLFVSVTETMVVTDHDETPACHRKAGCPGGSPSTVSLPGFVLDRSPSPSTSFPPSRTRIVYQTVRVFRVSSEGAREHFP